MFRKERQKGTRFKNEVKKLNPTIYSQRVEPPEVRIAHE